MLTAIIVDDEKIIRETLLNNIPWESLGFTNVKQAPNGLLALDLAKETLPDLLLSDIRMPRMNGIELGIEIRNLNPTCKIIYLSAYSDKEYLKSAIKLSAVDYIEKPLVLTEIIKIVNSTSMACLEEKKKNLEQTSLSKQKLAVALCKPIYNDLLLEDHLYFPAYGEYRTVLINFYLTKTNPLPANYKENLENILQQFDLTALTGPYEQDQIILQLLLDHAATEESLLNALESFMLSCQLNGINVFIAVGQKVPALGQLFSSFNSASSLLNCLFFCGFNHIIWEILPQNNRYEFDPNISEKFYTFFKENQKDKAISQIDAMINEIKACTQSPINYIKNGFLVLVLEMNRYLEENQLSGDDLIEDAQNEKRFIWEIISAFSTISELEGFIKQHTLMIFNQLNNEDNQQHTARNISKYIQDHLQDINLSILSISQRFFLSANYVSFIFKRDNHMTINQYITAKRMEKAKSLLLNKKNTLIEISAMVGYSDPKYFARVFKKELGLTTSEFRERNRK